MGNDSWNPSQYEKFLRERSAPFFDLAELVRKSQGMRVVDLGCGTGELTRWLHESLGARETLGVDASPNMLEKAGGIAVPGLRFERADISTFSPPRPCDLVVSNAALHFLPDHAALFARLSGFLSPGGQLAVQIPANQDHPTHLVAREVAGEDPFVRPLGGYIHPTNPLPVQTYAELLHDLGFAEQLVRLNVYTHLLESRDAVVEWMKGSILTEYQSRLSPELYAEYVERYRERLLPRLSAAKPYFFTFKRVLVWAMRPERPLPLVD